MAEKRRAEDSESVEQSEAKCQRRSLSLATRYLLAASSSPWISIDDDTEPVPMLRRNALPVHHRLGTSPVTTSGNESTDVDTSFRIKPGVAAAAQGIASFISENGQPTLLPQKYMSAARLAAAKCREVSDEVYDGTFIAQSVEETTQGVNKGFSSTGKIATGVGHTGCTPDSEVRSIASNAEPQQATRARMTASEQVFASHSLVERILLEYKRSGSPASTQRLRGVNKSFRHVLMRSAKLRKLVTASGRSSWMRSL